MGAFDDLVPTTDQTRSRLDQSQIAKKSLTRQPEGQPNTSFGEEAGFTTGIAEEALSALMDLFKGGSSLVASGAQMLRGKPDLAAQDASTALKNVFGEQQQAELGNVFRQMGINDRPVDAQNMLQQLGFAGPAGAGAEVGAAQPAAIGGLVGETVLNPTNLIPIGGVASKAGKAGQVVEEGLSEAGSIVSKQLAKRVEKETAQASENLFKNADFDLTARKSFDDFEKQISDKQAQLLETSQDQFLDPKTKAKTQKELATEVDDLKYQQVVNEMSDFENDITKRTILPNPNPLTSLVQTYVSNKGQFGGALYRQLEKASNLMDGMRAKWLTSFEERGNLPKVFGALNKEQRQNFFATMEGFEDASSPAVKAVVDIAKKNRTEIADEAIKRGVQIKNNNSSTAKFFSIRENHMPHQVITPKQVLLNQAGLNESLEYGVRTGRFEDLDEAKKVWDAYSDANKKNVEGLDIPITEENEAFFKWLVKSKQADNVEEAVKKFRFTMDEVKSPKAGSLESERLIDIPFFDVAPERVLSRYYSSVSKRFGEIDTLGRNNEIANNLISGIKQEFGDKDAERVTNMVNLMTGATKPSQLGEDVAGMLRDVEAARKLSMAVFMNLTQTSNTAAVTGIMNTNKALLEAISKEGRDFAYKSGVLFSEMARSMYGVSDDLVTGKVVDGILKATGFSEVERMNRIIAALAGKHFANEQAMKYIASNGTNKTAGRALRNMGLNADSILKRGSIAEKDVMGAVREIVNRTQFRSRVLDSPEWAASPWGKLANQFKNFGENQVKFLREEIINEAKQGNTGPLMRYLTVAPPAYVAAKTLKSAVAGKDSRLDTRTGIQKAAEVAANMGMMGMFYDIAMSMNFKQEGWVASLIPTMDTLGKGGSAAFEALRPVANRVLGQDEARFVNMKPLSKLVASSVPVFGSRITQAMKSPEDKQKEASRLIKEGTERGLDVNRIIEALREDKDINVGKAINSAKTGSKRKKQASNKLRKEAASGDIGKLLGF